MFLVIFEERKPQKKLHRTRKFERI